MFCSKCGAQNADDDAFCGSCGARLASSDTNAAAAEEEDLVEIPMDSRAEFAMLRPPESEMRPLTKVAYDIHDSEQGKTVSGALSVIFVGLCLGMIATLLAIFEKMNRLTYSLKSTSETELTKMYNEMPSEITMDLVWLCLLLASLVLLYIVVGKLKLRLKKINRKERKFKAKGLFIDI